MLEREQLLDELARCYMRAALSRLLDEEASETKRPGTRPPGLESTVVHEHGHQPDNGHPTAIHSSNST